MKTDKNNKKHIIAEDGFKFVRKADGLDYGTEVFLGNTWYIGGKKLDEPHMEVPEDFEEVEMTETEKAIAVKKGELDALIIQLQKEQAEAEKNEEKQ